MTNQKITVLLEETGVYNKSLQERYKIVQNHHQSLQHVKSLQKRKLMWL